MQNLLRGLVTVAILIGGLLPLASGMRSAKITLSLYRSEETVRALSAVFMEYLQLPSSSLLYEQILGLGSLGNNLFLGGMLLCLASVGTITVFSSQVAAENSKTPPRSRQARLPSLRRYSIFYISMACVAFILSLGMAFTPIHTQGLGAYRFLVWLSPYSLLYKFVPGFSSIRSPDRFSIFMAFFLAILAGVGMLWVCLRFRSRWRWALIISLISVTIFELCPISIRLVKVPGKLKELPCVYQHLKKLPSDAVLIEFPLLTSLSEHGLETTSRYIYFSTFHWHRLVNGYSGFALQSHSELIEILTKSKTKAALSALKAFGIQYIVAHWNNMNNEEKTLLQTLKVEGNLKPLFHEENQHTLYQIENIQHENTTPWFPNLERFTIYESEVQPRSVTLCFYYQMEAAQALLVTPWKNPIECEVSWYRKLAAEKDSNPVLVKKVSYKGSKLLHAESNAIAMDVPAPASGKYQVVVRHRLSSHSVTKTGVCEIFRYGFVRFREVP